MSSGALPIVNFAGAGITAQMTGWKIYKSAEEHGLMPPAMNFIERNIHPGGRMKSRIFDPPDFDPVVIVDGEARWDHRASKNRYFQFIFHNFIVPHARQFGLDPEKLQIDNDEFNKLFYHDQVTPSRILLPNGQYIPARRGEALDKMEEKLAEFREAQRHALNPRKDISVAELGAMIGPVYALDVRLLATWLGVALDKASGNEAIIDPATSGGYITNNGKGGPQSLLTVSLRSRGAKFHMGKTIQRIEAYADHCVFVDQNNKPYVADEGVVTFSVGVMQRAFHNGSIDFGRRGPLPKLVNAVSQMMMANMTKLAIASHDIHIEGRVYFERDGRTAFIDALPYSVPHITYGGPSSVEVELMTPDERYELVCNRLHELEQPYKNLTPEHILCSQANTSPEFFGAYSILEVNGERSDPITDQTVDYGGEANTASDRSPGTTEGAYDAAMEMGERKFNRIKHRLPPMRDDPGRGRLRDLGDRLAA